jgi:enoyl-[acyl-carrier protein] reductase I
MKLLHNKKGIILGAANEKSIAWGIARAAHEQGAQLGFSYAGQTIEKRVRPLAESLNSSFVESMDVTSEEQIDAFFSRLGKHWGSLDFMVHSIAFAGKQALQGRFLDTSREDFLSALEVSCYSLTALARRAAPLMTSGGSILTLTYLGSVRAVPHYNIMGVAKAALESSVRYLAADLGPEGVRVNALSPGPIRTLSASGISGFRRLLDAGPAAAPLRRNITQEDVANSALYFLSDLSSGVTGEVHHVDAGFNITIGLEE